MEACFTSSRGIYEALFPLRIRVHLICGFTGAHSLDRSNSKFSCVPSSLSISQSLLSNRFGSVHFDKANATCFSTRVDFDKFTSTAPPRFKHLVTISSSLLIGNVANSNSGQDFHPSLLIRKFSDCKGHRTTALLL